MLVYCVISTQLYTVKSRKRKLTLRFIAFHRAYEWLGPFIKNWGYGQVRMV